MTHLLNEGLIGSARNAAIAHTLLLGRTLAGVGVVVEQERSSAARPLHTGLVDKKTISGAIGSGCVGIYDLDAFSLEV